MSMDITTTERVCYVHCNFCDTILAVSVPWSSLYNLVTVRCGHCANLLSVNLGPSLPSLAPQDFQLMKQHHDTKGVINKPNGGRGSSSSVVTTEVDDQQLTTPHIRPPEKRQRVPSAYNKFIKEEIQRIKASNPEISHREAFSAAAKNWAHFPHIHFGLTLEGQKRAKLDQNTLGVDGTNKSHEFY